MLQTNRRALYIRTSLIIVLTQLNENWSNTKGGPNRLVKKSRQPFRQRWINRKAQEQGNTDKEHYWRGLASQLAILFAILCVIKTFPYTYASEETKPNFCELFPNFFTSSERFCLLQAAQELKQNFCVFKKSYQNKTKLLQIVPEFLKTKENFYLFQKKFGNGPEQKLLDQIFLVLIENVLFRSRNLFQKQIYSIFFGTKAAKRKLSIL